MFTQHSHILRVHILYTNFARTEWRRLIGSPKLQIIFHQRATKHRALLLKMTYKDKGSYESLPPCSSWFADKGSYGCSHLGWRRPIEYPIRIGHFPPKSPIISGSFAKNHLQLKASHESSLPCTTRRSSGFAYGVATIGRLLKIPSLFCRI